MSSEYWSDLEESGVSNDQITELRDLYEWDAEDMFEDHGVDPDPEAIEKGWEFLLQTVHRCIEDPDVDVIGEFRVVLQEYRNGETAARSNTIVALSIAKTDIESEALTRVFGAMMADKYGDM